MLNFFLLVMLCLAIGAVIMLGIWIYLLLVFDRLRVQAPFVPAPWSTAKKIPQLAPVKVGEKVFDLGCGDGRILIEYAKQCQAQCIGYEMGELPFVLAQNNFKKSKVKITLTKQDFFQADLRDADLVFLYLLPDLVNQLETKLRQELKPATRVVCLAFPLNNFQAENIFEVDGRNLYVYKMPQA